MSRSRDHHNYSNGAFAGVYWTGYRYGSNSETASAPIFKGAKRQSIIDRTMDVLRDWRLSPFENEGAAVAGLRTALCLQGYGWRRSDREARTIVQESLNLLGAERPSWDEGQQGYAVPKEDCNWCGQPIDQTLMGKERRFSFCSEECARIALTQRNLNQTRRDSRIFTDAWDVIQRTRNPVTTCGYCGTAFRPVIATHNKYCSLECSSKAQIVRPERECRTCGKLFRPHSPDPKKGHYCSLKCRSTGGFTTAYERTCAWCFTPFVGKVPSAQCCSPTCAVIYSGMKSGKRVPKRISPLVLDYLFRRQGLRVTPERIAA